MKLAVIILSDPQGGAEALGRVFNALALAADATRRGDPAEVVFAGTGTRWPAELAQAAHPAHALYTAVRPQIRGASKGCAAVFEAQGLEACGVPHVADNPIDGTPGLASLHKYLADGWQTLVF